MLKLLLEISTAPAAPVSQTVGSKPLRFVISLSFFVEMPSACTTLPSEMDTLTTLHISLL